MIIKRIFDLIISAIGILFLSPLLGFVAIWIKLDSTGPVFFKQYRVGINNTIFKIIKFRTMAVDAEAVGEKVTIGEDPRITKVGKMLRKYKLDELPQLFNVLKGEMSFVGPRPEVPEYVAYWPEDKRREILSVPPGITDYAAIEYRNENEILGNAEDPINTYIQEIIPIKLDYYIHYVRTRNFFVDMWLILKTLGLIFTK